jgi:phosphoribosyl-ATP pyrophosphohydrolase/phosphoribosyl-AMP cyclohydrolase/histidinol dehydrogenase
MLGVPAQVAGCKNITLSTPPRQDGSISPEIIYIAQLTGVKTIVKAGGAHAIAAMAYGTESVPKADKLYGPGNQFVTAAKMVRSYLRFFLFQAILTIPPSVCRNGLGSEGCD